MATGIDKNNVKQQWEKFSFRSPSKRNKVNHVTHLDNGFRILQDKAIKSTLVTDSDRLNFLKLSVSWIAPNDWDNSEGSFYGNIAFSFDFAKLISTRKLYWFDQPDRTNAVRFLISAVDYSNWLVEYNPEIDKGPLRFNTVDGSYEWATAISFELMFEGDLPLKDCEQLRFVKHHQTICLKKPPCKKRYSSLEASLIFVAGLVAKQIKVDKKLLFDKDGKLHSSIQQAVNTILLRFSRKATYKHCVILGTQEAEACGQACFYFISLNHHSFWKLMAQNFDDWSDYKTTLQQILAAHFDVSESTLEDK